MVCCVEVYVVCSVVSIVVWRFYVYGLVCLVCRVLSDVVSVRFCVLFRILSSAGFCWGFFSVFYCLIGRECSKYFEDRN